MQAGTARLPKMVDAWLRVGRRTSIFVDHCYCSSALQHWLLPSWSKGQEMPLLCAVFIFPVSSLCVYLLCATLATNFSGLIVSNHGSDFIYLFRPPVFPLPSDTHPCRGPRKPQAHPYQQPAKLEVSAQGLPRGPAAHAASFISRPRAGTGHGKGEGVWAVGTPGEWHLEGGGGARVPCVCTCNTHASHAC